MELTIIDEGGKNLGKMAKESALSLAKEKGLDLIEIAPNAKPPVARIMSFDKFRYQQEKKEKKQRTQQKGQESKQIQISIREALHDLQIKAKKIQGFLEEGNQVSIVVVLRGREKGNKNFAFEKLNEFLKIIPIEFKFLLEPKLGGRGIIMQIAKV